MSNASSVQSFQDGSVIPQRRGDQDNHLPASRTSSTAISGSNHQNTSGANTLYKTDQPEQELAAGLPSPTEHKDGQDMQKNSTGGKADSVDTGTSSGEQRGVSKEALQGPHSSPPREKYKLEKQKDKEQGQLTGSKSSSVNEGNNNSASAGTDAQESSSIQEQQQQQQSKTESRQQGQSSHHHNGLLVYIKEKLGKVLHHNSRK